MDGVRELVSKHDWDAVQAPMLFQQNSNISSKICIHWGACCTRWSFRLRRLRLQDLLDCRSCNLPTNGHWQKGNQMDPNGFNRFKNLHHLSPKTCYSFISWIYHQTRKWIEHDTKSSRYKVIPQLGLVFPSSFDRRAWAVSSRLKGVTCAKKGTQIPHPAEISIPDPQRSQWLVDNPQQKLHPRNLTYIMYPKIAILRFLKGNGNLFQSPWCSLWGCST